MPARPGTKWLLGFFLPAGAATSLSFNICDIHPVVPTAAEFLQRAQHDVEAFNYSISLDL